MHDSERRLRIVDTPTDVEPVTQLHEVATVDFLREEVLARKLRLQTRCVVALTDDEFERLYPKIMFGEQ